MNKRETLGAAVRAIRASTVLPARGLVGPGVGRPHHTRRRRSSGTGQVHGRVHDGHERTGRDRSRRAGLEPLAGLAGAGRMALPMGSPVLRDGAVVARGLTTAGIGSLSARSAITPSTTPCCGLRSARPDTPLALSVIVMDTWLDGSARSSRCRQASVPSTEACLIGALVLYGAAPIPAAGAVVLDRGLSLSLAVTLNGATWGSRANRQSAGATRA
jgi:hypothetical protein